MKKILLSFTLFISFSVIAQNTIPNGNFESWTSTQFIDLDNYVTPVVESQFFLGTPISYSLNR